MKLRLKLSNVSSAGDKRATVSVFSFGSVTVEATLPPENVRRANIGAGQAALKRGKRALVKAGIKLPREKGVPLYFGCEDYPGFMVQELDGKRTLGRFVEGRFCAVKEAGPIARKGRT